MYASSIYFSVTLISRNFSSITIYILVVVNVKKNRQRKGSRCNLENIASSKHLRSLRTREVSKLAKSKN